MAILENRPMFIISSFVESFFLLFCAKIDIIKQGYKSRIDLHICRQKFVQLDADYCKFLYLLLLLPVYRELLVKK